MGETIKEPTTTFGWLFSQNIEIPCYQRGYVWGKQNPQMATDSATYMLKTLEKYFCDDNELFIQGITCVEKNGKIVVVDGQQRCTFFYLLLSVLGAKPNSFTYAGSRGAKVSNTEDSPQSWLLSLNDTTSVEENENEPYQDIYFFKKTIRLFKESALYETYSKDKETLIKFIQERIKFIKITVKEGVAVKTFTMMNGNKAQMKDYELIKADLLRKASLGDGGYGEDGGEWDNISFRSRYARLWDNWQHWWNKEDVKQMFNCSKPMGLLLDIIFNRKEGQSLFNAYESYEPEKEPGKPWRRAKLIFKHLLQLQNKFEELYNNPILYNYFGLITRLIPNGKTPSEAEAREIRNFVQEYINNEAEGSLELTYNKLLFKVKREPKRFGRYV